jgi:subtilisin family serine protease
MKRLSYLSISLLLSVALYGRSGTITRAAHPVKGKYIVVFNDADGVHPATRAAQLTRSFGGRATAVWGKALRGFAIEATEAQALALTRSPLVKSVEEDGYGSVATTQTTDIARWGLDRIDQATLPTNGTFTYCQDGTGVDIYIVDSGVWESHTEFNAAGGGTNRVTAGVNTCNGPSCLGAADSPCNAGGPPTQPYYAVLRDHGTMVASVAAGLTNGVAKNATIIPVRATDCHGQIAKSWLISAAEWVDLDHQAGHPAVMNCSFTFDKDPEDDAIAVTVAINHLIDDGVVVVAGAGNTNESANTTLLPTIPRVITVGGSNFYDQRWLDDATHGSNRGTKVDLFAPGKSIRVATLDDSTFNTINSGTSFSAPFVTGVVAQYLQVHPTATPDQVTTWLLATATPGVLTNLGAGSPNLLARSVCN